jgi:UDP-N-acetylmuramoylalanine--D-glutamate ligase
MKGLHIEKRKVAVIGFGISGKSVCSFFLAHGVSVDVFEDKPADSFEQGTLSEFMSDIRFSICFGGSTDDFDVTRYDYVIASPGVPLTHPIIVRAHAEDVEFVTDINVFLRLFRSRYPHGNVISVTGSNGKSTTVSLMYDALTAAGVDAYLGGNIGMSPLDFFTQIRTERPVVILETSSYQLEYLKLEDYFDIAAITNISDNHLNRYGGNKGTYAKAKLGGIHPEYTDVVVNFDDEDSKKYVIPFLPSKHVLGVQFESGFSENVISLENNSLVHRTEGESVTYIESVSKMHIKGIHNVYNCAFVCAILVLLEISPNQTIEQAVCDFKGLLHRTQFLGEIDGVTYVNDSKSTSPDATNKALETVASSKNVILITGGNDKDISYEPMRAAWTKYVKGIILLPGSANPKLKVLADGSGVELLGDVQTMQEAFDVARSFAREGDMVLLSPATDSHASFKSFEDRGNQFIECVQSLRMQ